MTAGTGLWFWELSLWSLVLANYPDQNRRFVGSDVLKKVPLVDGHNKLPANLFELEHSQLAFNFSSDLTQGDILKCNRCHTDLPRLKKGRLGSQFWVASMNRSAEYRDVVETIFEQIEIIKQLIRSYPRYLHYVTTAQGIWDAFNVGKVGSLIAVQSACEIDMHLQIVKLLFELGVRYLKLSHRCERSWDDMFSEEEATHTEESGLTNYGKFLVQELNWLGMIIDVSHLPRKAVADVLMISHAPVIFSNSTVFNLCNSSHSVDDAVLQLLKKKNGVVMASFSTHDIQCNSSRRATIYDVVDHINYIRSIAGVDHIGIGAGYDNGDDMPIGLEDVSKYPNLFDLLARGHETHPAWSEEDLKKLAGLNLIRVFRTVEKVGHEFSTVGIQAYEDST